MKEEDYFVTKLGDNFKIEGFNIYAKSTNMWRLGNWLAKYKEVHKD